MRSCMLELEGNRIRFITAILTEITPDTVHLGKYIATNKRRDNPLRYDNITKLTEDTYRDNYGYYYLTENHPLFNASLLTRSAVQYKLDDKFMVSHLLEGVRYLVKKSILSASASYNK